MRFRQIAIIFFAITAFAAWAEIKLSGTVADENGHPIEFATVSVDGTALGTFTDTKGNYSLSVADRDTLMVVFTCIGYEDVRRKIIKPQGSVVVGAKLYKKHTQLSEVEVVEYKKQLSQMQGLDISQIKLTPDASGGGVEALLSTMAGVTSKNEMSSQYMVRGGTYDENSVYINGIEVYRPQLITNGQQEGLSIINPDMVGEVQFSTGGFSAEYGDKMSSVLDIKYREPESFEASVGASLMGASAAVGHSTKKYSQLHGFRYKRNTTMLGKLENKGEYDPQYIDYQTFIKVKPTDRLSVSLLGNISINKYRFTPTTRETSFGTMANAKSFKVYFDGYESDRFETYLGALSLDYKINSNNLLTLCTSGFLTNEFVSYDIHGEYWLDEAGVGGEGGVGGELGVGKYHEHARDRLKASVFAVSLKGVTKLRQNTLSYGVGFQHESIYDRGSQWEWRDSAGYSLPHSEDQVNVIYNRTSSHDIASNRFFAYITDTYRLQSDKGYFTFNGGVRLSYWDYNREFLVSPRVSVGYVPARNERLAFRVAGGLYYQAPFYKEFRYVMTDQLGNSVVFLNNNIKSQRSVQVIAGGDYSFRALNRPFKFSAELYYKNLSNLIPYEIDNLQTVYSGFNDSKGYVAGIDFKFFGQFVEGTDSWISFSLMTTGETLRGVKVPRPTDQRYSLALYFTDYFPKVPKLKFNLKFLFSDGLIHTAPQSTRDIAYFRAPSYKRLDLGLSYQLLGEKKWIKSAWIGLDVFNLFDMSNVSSYYWVTDVNNLQYAVPNYLTRRQFSVRLNLNF